MPTQPMVSLSQRRVHSPSLNDIWVAPGLTKYTTAAESVSTVKFPTPSSRPNLGSIDVDVTAKPSKSALPLTPPLTPASTRATDSEASDTRSSRSNSVDVDVSAARSNFALYSQERQYAAVSSWASSEGTAKQAVSRNDNPPFDHFAAENSEDDSMLPSPISPARPRHPSPHREREFESYQPSRFIFVSGVPRSADSHALKQAFTASGELKGIFVRFQPDHGAIILAFFDLRHTIRAHRQIASHTFFDGVRLTSRFISPDDLRNLIGQSNFVNQNDGELHIDTSFAGPEVELDALALQNVLASFGDLRVFNVETRTKSFHVEYFDARDALSAVHALNNRVILGVRLHLTLRDTAASSVPFPTEDRIPFPLAESSPPMINGSVPFPSMEPPSLEPHPSGDERPCLQHALSEKNLRGRPRSLSTSSPVPQLDVQDGNSPYAHYTFPSQDSAHTPMPPVHPRVKTPPQHVHGRRISNIYHFDSVGRTMLELPRAAPPRPRSISVSSDTDSPIAGRLALPPSPSGGAGRMTFSPQSAVETRGLPSPYTASMILSPEEPQWTHDEHAYAAEQYLGSPQLAQFPALQLQMHHRTLAPRHPRSLGGLGLEMVNEKEKEMQPERNKIDIGKIERGEETRTTVMIKNIPNKMSDRNLIDFINDVCCRKIDFLYLRMDFTNGCNVGYAFVNFVNVEDLLHFAKTKLGTKWNLFSSEKVLGMSYANYQGKEALIDKFRSSSIMDQREAWRPKLFYSHGPKQGEPEDFPAPTHIRRKERSNLLPNELHQSRPLFHHQPHMRT